MKTTEVVTDGYGQVVGGGIHDTVIQSFNFTEGDRFDICLRDSSGNKKCMSLRGIEKIGFKDLVNGTIISEIFYWPLAEGCVPLNSENEAWRVLLGGNYQERDFEYIVFRLMAQHATHALVFFESSYGGSIAVICREMALLHK